MKTPETALKNGYSELPGWWTHKGAGRVINAPGESIESECFFPIPFPMHLFYPAVSELSLEYTGNSKLLSWVLWDISEDCRNWGQDHGNPDLYLVGQKCSWQSRTCNGHLKSGESCRAESLTCGICVNSESLVSRLNWIVGHLDGDWIIGEFAGVGKNTARLVSKVSWVKPV